MLMLFFLHFFFIFFFFHFFEMFGVHSRWKRNAENRTKFFGKGSGRGIERGFVGGKRRRHKTLGRILMNDEINKCLTPVKYEAVRGVGGVVGLGEGVDGMSVDLVGICECPFQTRVVPDLC